MIIINIYTDIFAHGSWDQMSFNHEKPGSKISLFFLVYFQKKTFKNSVSLIRPRKGRLMKNLKSRNTVPLFELLTSTYVEHLQNSNICESLLPLLCTACKTISFLVFCLTCDGFRMIRRTVVSSSARLPATTPWPTVSPSLG